MITSVNQPVLTPSSSTPAEVGQLACSHISRHVGQVQSSQREAAFHQHAVTLWMTGLSGSGKSSIAYALERVLFESGHPSYVLDGDNLRHHLNRDLGFSEAERSENIRRTAEVARLMNEAGLIVIGALISPLRAYRDMARCIVGAERFIEVHVCTGIAVCEARDPKGLYAKARAGAISGFTGVSAPYEPPIAPALQLDTQQLTVDQAAQSLLTLLRQRASLN
jgi:adenylylsulfate kinase